MHIKMQPTNLQSEYVKDETTTTTIFNIRRNVDSEKNSESTFLLILNIVSDIWKLKLHEPLGKCNLVEFSNITSRLSLNP